MKMDNKHSDRLDSSLLEISKSLDVKDTLLQLTVRGIFDINDSQLVQNDSVCRTDAEKRQKIVELLRSRGNKGYWAFCHVLKRRSPHLFSLLHVVNEDEYCPECTSGIASIPNCAQCEELPSVFMELGMCVESVGDIVDSFKSLKSELALKRDAVSKLTDEIEVVRQECRQYISQNTQDKNSLRYKGTEIAEWEGKYNKLLESKEKIEIDNESWRQRCDEQCAKIRDNEKDLSHLRKIIEDYMNNPIYENRSAIDKNEIEDLKYKLKQITLERDENGRQAAQAKLEASKSRIHEESLEDVIKRLKLNNNRLLEKITNDNEATRVKISAMEETQQNLKDQLQTVTIEKEDITKEKEYLLKKIHEKSSLLNEAKITERALEIELDKIKAMWKIQKTSKENLLQEYEIMKEERNKLREHNKELQDKIDSRVKKSASQSDFQNEVYPTCFDEIDRKRQQETNDLIKRVKEFSQILPSDIEVTLRKGNESSKFGLQFGQNKGLVMLGESNIVISGLDSNNNMEHLSEISVGDYVMYINDKNVQYFEKSELRKVCPEDASEMKLVLRRPNKRTYENIKIVPFNAQQFDDLGIKLGVFINLQNKDGATSELKEMDEIVKIGDSDVIARSLENIKRVIMNGVAKKSEISVRRHKWNHTMKKIRSNSMCESTRSVRSRKYSQNTVSSNGSEVFRRIPEENSGDTGGCGRISWSPENPTRVSMSERALPIPLPRIPLEKKNFERPLSSHHTMDYSMKKGEYDYVVSHQFNENRELLPENCEKKYYENSIKSITIHKEKYETFGLTMVGGNKAGIYVDSVENWKPASRHKIKRGFQILKIDNISMEKVAYCFAVDILRRQCAKSEVTFLFKETNAETYEEILLKKPYDSFHIETLKPYTARLAGEMSFKKNEILRVTNSLVFTEPTQPYKWQAVKEDRSDTCRIEGLIPRQISPRSPAAVDDHLYEEIDQTLPREVNFSDRNIDGYYIIKEYVGQSLVP